MAAGNRDRRQQQDGHLGAEEKIRDHMQGRSPAAMKGVCEACAEVVFWVLSFALSEGFGYCQVIKVGRKHMARKVYSPGCWLWSSLSVKHQELNSH